MTLISRDEHAHFVGKRVLMLDPHPKIGKTGIVTAINYYNMLDWGLAVEGDVGAKDKWVTFDADEIREAPKNIFEQEVIMEQLNLLCVGRKITLAQNHSLAGQSGVITQVVPNVEDGIEIEILLDSGETTIANDLTQFHYFSEI